jgi:hypothetical protein
MNVLFHPQRKMSTEKVVITSAVSGQDNSNTLMLNYNNTLASIFAYAHPSNIEIIVTVLAPLLPGD